MLASVTYWLSALSSCSTIYSRNDVNFLQEIIHSNPQKSFVLSIHPWMYLKRTLSTDCAILLLDDISDYEEAEQVVSITHLRTEVFLITPLSQEDLNITQPKFHLNVLHYANNSIKGKILLVIMEHYSNNQGDDL